MLQKIPDATKPVLQNRKSNQMGMPKEIMMDTPEKLTFDYVIEKAQFLFFILDADGRIFQVNRYAESILGCPLDRKNFQELIVDFSGSFNLEPLIQERSKEHLLNIQLDSGLPQSFYFQFKPMGNRVMAMGRLDTQELETIRKQIYSLNQELSNLTRQLHKQNAQLKKLNQEKNQFLGMAAHDLRKPIGLVISYSEFLLEEAQPVLNDQQVGFLTTIMNSCSFMKRLVDDFLDVSAIEAGKFDLDLQPALIQDALEQSLRLNNLQANKKHIDLQIHTQKNIPRTLMDRSKIEQVITNLVSNAIEHSDPGTQVILRLGFDPQTIYFSVQDQGPGIAPDEMEKLFKPFEKTRSRKTAGEKSTGLGMIITRKIIQAHQGDIWVESKLKQGTTLHFKLPLNEQKQ